jgi:hypothetical protein
MKDRSVKQVLLGESTSGSRRRSEEVIYVYENRTLKPVKIILSRWGDEGE